MKRIFTHSLVFLLLSVLLLSGCKETKSTSNTKELKFITLEYHDTAYIKGNEENLFDEAMPQTVDFIVDYPSGNSQLSLAIQEWINEQISNFFYEEGRDSTIFYETELSDGNNLLSYYGKNISKDFEQKEEGNIVLPKSFSMIIKKIFDNQHCVTYEIEESIYLGGAHGTTTIYGCTFRKTDGRKFGHDMLNGKRIEEALKDGLAQYFGADNNILDVCWKEKVSEYSIALPYYPPYITNDGIKFIYQQYEICPYVFGLPEVTIPLENGAKYLTHTAEKLIR